MLQAVAVVASPFPCSIPKLASESKVEVCAGDGQLTKACTDYGLKGKAFDESWSGLDSINELRKEVDIASISSCYIVILQLMEKSGTTCDARNFFETGIKHSCFLGGFKTCPPRKILRYATVETTIS